MDQSDTLADNRQVIKYNSERPSLTSGSMCFFSEASNLRSIQNHFKVDQNVKMVSISLAGTYPPCRKVELSSTSRDKIAPP